MPKAFLALLLALISLCLCAGALASSSMYHEVGDWGAQFETSDRQKDGSYIYTLNITRYLGSDTHITVPDSLTWKGVTYSTTRVSQIFMNSAAGKAVAEIVIPEGVTELDATFSGCASLTSVSLPASLRKIGGSTFRGCAALTSISLPAGVTEIGNSAFYACKSLKRLVIPAGVTVVGTYWAQNCDALEEVILPDGVTEIQKDAFGYCRSLRAVPLPASLHTIGSQAFYGCTALTEVTIPGHVKKVDFSAFSGCSSLASVTLEEGVESLGMQAFYGTAIERIHIPASLTELTTMYDWTKAYNPLPYCPRLTEITVAPGNPSYKSVDGALYSKDGTVLIAYPQGRGAAAWQIPAGVTALADRAVAIEGITVDVPDSVTHIGDGGIHWTATMIVGPDSFALAYAKKHDINYIIRGQEPAPGNGDLDGDGRVSMTDLQSLMRYLRRPGYPAIDEAAADLSGDGRVTMTDAVLLLTQLCE